MVLDRRALPCGDSICFWTSLFVSSLVPLHIVTMSLNTNKIVIHDRILSVDR